MRIIPLPPVLTACLAALFVALGPIAANAQTVYGVVVADDTGEPVTGAMVLMTDTLGLSRGSSLSDSLGRFSIHAPRPGPYALAADRVGYQSLRPDTVHIPADSLQVQLRAGSRRVTLPPMTASARSRCGGRIETNPHTAIVWQEARKALASTALLEESGGYEFTARVDRREVRLRGRDVMSHHAWVRSGTGRPFVTMPPELLVDGGYVQADADSLILYGIGAAVVLSELFLQRHCFGLRDGGADRVGLEFVPLRTSGRPDVRGVLWLDRATSELRTLEFTYTGLTFRGPVERLGGELEFRHLPSGGWIVSRWMVRGPLLTRNADWELAEIPMARFRIRALRETSGEVLAIRDSRGMPVRMR
ncbi:MAG TPA: carboxypeptidase-like regulatory domain-containing protein [Longimicrobium sp.]